VITTVVFDLDDTLYDEIDYCRSGFKAAADYLSKKLQSLNAAETFNCLWRHFKRGNHKTTFNAALDELAVNYTDELITKLVETYRNHKPNISLPEDSRLLLNRLCGLYQLALLTDGFLPAQELKVKALKIDKFFDCIVYTEQLGRQYWKPSPAGFEKILMTLDTKPENTVYLADNPEKDFVAPNKLGFMTVRVIRPNGLHRRAAEDSRTAADYVIPKLTELPSLFG